jgi:Bacterial membrane protein YfhO
MEALLTRLRKLIRLEGYMAMAVFAAIAAILFFWDPLFTWSADKIMGGGDIATMFAPWLSFIYDTLRQYKTLPLWNPYLFSGVPYYANPQPMMFYPFTYLGLLMPLTRAMALTLVIHVWLMGMGMYGWLRSLGATHAGAFLAGAAFAFTGTFSVRVGAGHYATALQFAWWPLSAWALRTAFERRSWRWAILSGVPLALGLLSGHTATCLLLYMMLGIYTLYEAVVVYKQDRRWGAGTRVLGLAVVAVLTSLALAAIQYLPFLNFSQLSVRASDPSLDFAARFSLPIGHLITLLVPDFFGEPIRTGYWSVEGYGEFTYYVGALIFLVAVAGAKLIQSGPRRLLFFLALALGAVMVELGPDGVLFMLFYRFVPGIALTRAPGRAGMIYTFAVITAAGLVWSELEHASSETIQRLLGIFNKTLVWVVSMITICAALMTFILYAAFKSPDTARLWYMGGQLTQFLVLFWATMAIFYAWRNRSLPPRAVNVLAVALVMFDLWSYGLKNVRPGDNSQDPGWPRVAGFMQDKPGYRVAPADFQFFQHNGALAYRLRNQYGYDPIVLARYQALLDSAVDYFDPVYDLLNVRYIVVRNPLEFKEGGPKLPVSFEWEDLRIYRRPSVLPRMFIVHNAQVVPDDAVARAALHAASFEISRTVTLPAAPPCSLEPFVVSAEEIAQVVGESPNHLELATRSASAGLLVLSEVDYPGWQVKVDGQPAQVLRADTVLRAVCLPAGSHTVRFEFAPRDLVIGAIVSCLALVVVMGAIIGWLISARRQSGS